MSGRQRAQNQWFRRSLGSPAAVAGRWHCDLAEGQALDGLDTVGYGGIWWDMVVLEDVRGGSQHQFFCGEILMNYGQIGEKR